MITLYNIENTNCRLFCKLIIEHVYSTHMKYVHRDRNYTKAIHTEIEHCHKYSLGTLH